MKQNSINICDQYTRLTAVKMTCIVFLIVLLVGIALIAIAQGPSFLSFGDSFAALFDDSETAHAIIWKLRLPRIVKAILVGSGLGFAGVVFQAIVRNPLASPYTLEIASGAGFGAVLAIVFGAGFSGRYLIAGNAFFFALLSSFFIRGISRLRGSTTETMILAGIAIAKKQHSRLLKMY